MKCHIIGDLVRGPSGKLRVTLEVDGYFLKIYDRLKDVDIDVSFKNGTATEARNPTVISTGS